MESSLTPSALLAERWGDAWLISARAETFWVQLAQFQARFQAESPRNVLLVESEPIRFLAAFFAALQYPCHLWLANPQWGTQEWEQIGAQCPADLVIGTAPLALPSLNNIQHSSSPMGRAQSNTIPSRADSTPTHPLNDSATPSLSHPDTHPLIHIPTGGSSGNLQFATHTWETLTASVQGFRQHFECDRVDAYCVLPLYHVSGLMQALRCWVSGGKLTLQPFRELLQTGAIAATSANQFLSLVPTQLQRLLSSDLDFIPWLRQFKAILLGGAPPWPSLLQRARELNLPLAPTYGMTETASQVATLLPHEFLAGQTGSGRALLHASLSICDEQGTPQPPHQIGTIEIAATSLALARGSEAIAAPLITGDLGYLDASGYLHVIGRASTLIFTGGEKVLPVEVEAAMLATGLVSDVAVVGVPDTDWGEQVVAVIPEAHQEVSDCLSQVLKTQLSPHKLPKQWLTRPTLPRNAQGKLNRAALRQWVMNQLRSNAAPTPPTLGSADGDAE